MSHHNNSDRLYADFTDVGTDWSMIEVQNVSSEYMVFRVRVFIVSGTATQVAFKLCEDPSGEVRHTPLEYTLTANEIDSLEEVHFITRKRNQNNKDVGSTFLFCKCDTTGNALEVILDITRRD